MAYVILGWLYLALLLWLSGLTLERCLPFGTSVSGPLCGFRRILVGWVGCLFVATLAHFFFRIGPVIHLCLIAALVYDHGRHSRDTLVRFRSAIRQLIAVPTFWVVGLSLGLFLAFVATDLPVYNLDDGRYHFSAIQWSKSFPLVPGLANLHDRFGTGSSWYDFHALFDWGWLAGRSYHFVNSFAILLLLITGLYETVSQRGRRRVAGFVLLLLMLVYFPFVRYWFATSVSPDMGVHFFVISFCLILFHDLETQMDGCHFFFLAFLASGAMLVRVTGLFLGTFWLLLLVRTTRKTRQGLWDLVLWSLLGAAPALALIIGRNLVLSGFVLFPMLASPWELDWAFPAGSAKALNDLVQNHALSQFVGARQHFSSTFDPNRLVALGRMFRESFVDQVGSMTGYIAFLPVLAILAITRRLLHASYSLIVILSAAVLYIFSGGVLRFGFGFVLGFQFLMWGWSLDLLRPHIRRWRRQIRILAGATLTALFGLYVVLPHGGVSARSAKFSYPVLLGQAILQSVTYLPRVPDPPPVREVSLGSGVRIHVAGYSEVPAGRYGRFHVSWNQGCEDSDFVRLDAYETCPTQNAFIGKMIWMGEVPIVGGIYKGLEARGTDVARGFRLARGPESD